MIVQSAPSHAGRNTISFMTPRGSQAKAREALFRPFAGSTKAGGTGLGLAIARDIARAHRGDIHLVRSDERGTQFRLEIPDA